MDDAKHSTYTAYGARNAAAQRSQSAFAGEVIERHAGYHLLGNRLYSPTLRRFLNPDPVSPFDDGGFNRYAYCAGDPVNRVDPSGNVAQAWIAGLLGFPEPALRTAGERRVLSNAVASPGSVASVSSAVTDIPTPLAGIGSVASPPNETRRAGGLFGWISQGSKASVAMGKAAARQDATGADISMSKSTVSEKHGVGYSRFTYISPVGDRRVDAYRGRGALLKKSPSRFLADIFYGYRPKWEKLTTANGGINFVADGAVNRDDISRLMKSLGKQGVSRMITILSGAHGANIGDNWKQGKRLETDKDYYLMDLSFRAKFAAMAGTSPNNIQILNIAKMSNAEFIEIANSDAIIVHAYCFGTVDWELMFQFNIRRAASYDI